MAAQTEPVRDRFAHDGNSAPVFSSILGNDAKRCWFNGTNASPGIACGSAADSFLPTSMNQTSDSTENAPIQRSMGSMSAFRFEGVVGDADGGDRSPDEKNDG